MPITLPPKTEPTVTHLALLIDSSGSMSGFGAQVVKNVNSILEELEAKAKSLSQKVTVSIYSFGHTVDALMINRPISEAPRLTSENYRPDGGTPLYDALDLAITHLQGVDAKNVANLVTLITDGEENSSKVGRNVLATRMVTLTRTDRWTFSAMVPKGYSGKLSHLSIPAGNIQEWETTAKGLDIGTQSLASSYAGYLNLRSTGATKSTGFFTAGVNTQQAKEIKKKLDDVRDEFKEMTVRTQDPKVLQEFVENRGLRFMKGRAFYQLTKAEKVQPHKEVLMRDIKSGAVYGGKEARDILGLPEYTEVKVKPEDHGDWDIFVQSTSNNRKLVNGTNVLYLK